QEACHRATRVSGKYLWSEPFVHFPGRAARAAGDTRSRDSAASVIDRAAAKHRDNTSGVAKSSGGLVMEHRAVRSSSALAVRICSGVPEYQTVIIFLRLGL